MRFANHGRRGPLIDQDLCKLHIICVNLHKKIHRVVEKMCICANTICDLCFLVCSTVILPHKIGEKMLLTCVLTVIMDHWSISPLTEVVQ